MRPNILGLVKFRPPTSVGFVISITLLIIVFHWPAHAVAQLQANSNIIINNRANSIEHDRVGGYYQPMASHKPIPCGTIATNHSHITVKNPHHPEPTYVKAICETVVERTHTNVNRLNIKFKQLELYRPNYDGSCMHDRFAVYTDLNIAVSPVLCGNHTGRAISIPFTPPLSSLIVSITTSDLDHDRAWELEIEQATTLLLVFMIVNSSLYQLAQAAAGAATASKDAAGAASTTVAASSTSTGAAATTTGQAATTTTTTSTSTSDSNSASAAGAGGAAAATTSQGSNNGPLSAVQGLVGGAFNIASMPLNTISASLNQLGLPNMATAPFGAITNLFHQAGSVYGR